MFKLLILSLTILGAVNLSNQACDKQPQSTNLKNALTALCEGDPPKLSNENQLAVKACIGLMENVKPPPPLIGDLFKPVQDSLNQTCDKIVTNAEGLMNNIPIPNVVQCTTLKTLGDAANACLSKIKPKTSK